MRKRTAREELARNTVDQVPRFNTVILSGAVIDRDLTAGIVELENGLAFQVSADLLWDLGVEAGDLVIARGELQTYAVDNIAGGIGRTTYVYVRGPNEAGGGNNLRIVRKSSERVVFESAPTCSISEMVRIRGGEYRVEAQLNIKSGEYKDLKIFIGEVDVASALSGLPLGAGGGARVYLIDEIMAEIAGRRGE